MIQRERIRVIFLHGAESYGLREVARLTNTSARKLRREVAAGYRDGAKVRGAWRLTWRQAACFALECWTLAEIHEALGSDAAAVLPPLLALRTVTVRLPEFLVRALETVATKNRTTLDAFLHYELMDFAGTWAEQMESIHSGFRQAYMFPGKE
ncbi:MAG TPA: hypothetical protein VNA69_16270 [Thermoanaerobaculia bacterium]|nr:hypothetical protein [Thermoanaerobaculia bacterium]